MSELFLCIRPLEYHKGHTGFSVLIRLYAVPGTDGALDSDFYLL